MINQPNPSNGCTNHAIVNTLIDLETGYYHITVGSWPYESQNGKPLFTTVLCVKYLSWFPEYHDQVEQTVNENPQWTGLPPYMPNAHCYFDMSTKQWEDPRSLTNFKSAQWGLIKKARSQEEYVGFTWDGSTFDSDATSQNRITGAVTLAMLSPEFTINWVLADNTTRLLDQSGMAQVGGALGAHVAAQFERGVTLRAQIEAATTQAEVEAVVW